MDITSAEAIISYKNRGVDRPRPYQSYNPNTAIQVITDSPRHRFHCDGATHTSEYGTHAFLERMRDASRSPLALMRKPAKSEFPDYPLLAVRHALQTYTTKQ